MQAVQPDARLQLGTVGGLLVRAYEDLGVAEENQWSAAEKNWPARAAAES